MGAFGPKPGRNRRLLPSGGGVHPLISLPTTTKVLRIDATLFAWQILIRVWLDGQRVHSTRTAGTRPGCFASVAGISAAFIK